MPKPRLYLIHWHEAEAEARGEQVRKLGYRVDCGFAPGGDSHREIKADPPAIVLIALDRLPSHGRNIGMALRASKQTRHVPLVFVGGARDKVERTRQMLPDATFTSWAQLASALRRAVREQPAAPVVPRSTSGYSGTPLPVKLGIRADAQVALLNAPQGFAATLGALPAGAKLGTRMGTTTTVAVLFALSLAELRRRLPAAAAKLPQLASLWVAWPKQTSTLHRDLGGNDVRRDGLATGLVDTKVCAIDADWSGLRFAHRRR